MRVSVAVKDLVHEFDAEPGERLLYAALRAGVPLAYECATGTCGSCRANLSGGEVLQLWPEAPGHAAHKTAESVLMCQVSAAQACAFVADKLVTGRAHAELPPRYLEGVTADMQRLTRDVTLVRIALPEPLDFAPGQFALLSVDGLPGWRAYSMVEGGATDAPSFIVKQKPGGILTRWFFERCVEGAGVRLFGPLGSATLRPQSDRDIVLLAGGSGLSMVLSVMEAATRTGHVRAHQADVVFGVRTPDDTFCLDRLAGFVEAMPETVRITVALSESADLTGLRGAYPLLRFEAGFVHEVAAAVIAKPAPGTTGFIAGPPPMIDAALRYLLVKARIPAGNIRYDKFT